MKRKRTKVNGLTALYERLSKDDENGGDSNSIIHQKQMLEEYAKAHSYTNYVHFTDDGWSGATFDRPAWNRLVEGVKVGEITTVIAKDLSRIGRDHLQVGFFTDILFREKEVHFIAINNGIDSDHQESSEFAPFLNIMNEWYVRDTSKKIKAVLKARGTSGKAHTSNIPPYGYLKDPENPDHWIVDEEAAAIVRRIFQMTIEGKGPYEIARILAKDRVERPSFYLGEKGLGNHAGQYDKQNPYAWRGNTVSMLISRPEYIGKTVNFRTYKDSYRDKRQKRAEKEDWVVFPGTQEPIIDTATWELAQKLRQNVRKANSLGEPNVLTGKVFCADCGAPMYNHRHQKGRDKVYYTAKGERRIEHAGPEDSFSCSAYRLSRQKFGSDCSIHQITTKALMSLILRTIRDTCNYVSMNEEQFVLMLQDATVMHDTAASDTIRQRIERNTHRIAELDTLIRRIYEDNVAGRLSDKRFQTMMSDFEREQDELVQAVEADQRDIDRIIGGENNVNHFLELVRRYQSFEELTPTMINEFVDKILVHEAIGTGANRTMEIEIYLNYIGHFQVPQEPEILTEEELAARQKEQDRLERKRASNRKYMKKMRERTKALEEQYQQELKTMTQPDASAEIAV